MYLEAVSLYLLRRQLAGQLRSAQLVRPGPADNARHGILTAAGDTGVEGGCSDIIYTGHNILLGLWETDI